MKGTGLKDGFIAYISHLQEEERYSTAKSYRDAWNSLVHYFNSEEISYEEITKECLHHYEVYLMRRGCMRNTISTYMRRLRCIYNRAVDRGEAPYVPQHFSGVFTGIESRKKRSLPIDELHRLMTVPVTDKKLRDTQLAVCLMFQYGGMPFVDFAHLKGENVRNNVLYYRRRKSGNSIRMELSKSAKRMQRELSNRTLCSSCYLMPFLSGHKSGISAYLEYREALIRFNRNLRRLRSCAGIRSDVTSYSIRHSFANLLKDQHVPIEKISELLGHCSIRTTQIYLRSFSLGELSKVAESCFRKVYHYKCGKAATW